MLFLNERLKNDLSNYSNTNFISEFNFESKSVIKHSGSAFKIDFLSSITPVVLLQKIKLLFAFHLF